jgi:membrane protein YdbS with pleckstrin-like domain
MGFPRRLLVEGEELVLDLRPHWIALAMPTLVTVAALVATVWAMNAFGADLVVLAIFVLVMLLYPIPRLISWLTSHFVVTSDRVIHRKGWIAKYSMEVPLEAINDVRFEQGMFDRIVGAGTLVIHSASEAGRQAFDHIRRPEYVQKTIYHQGELNQQRMRGGGPPAAAPPPAPSVTTELERLADLRARGVLSEEEFQAQKARILGSGS